MSQSFSKITFWFWWAALISVALCFFLWLIWQNLIPSGYLKITKDFCRETKFISNLYPENRVGGIETDEKDYCFQRILSEPSYFKIKMPRSFEQVKLKIFYQNPAPEPLVRYGAGKNQSLFQIGLMKIKQSPFDWRFQLKSIENRTKDLGDLKTADINFILGPEFSDGRQIEFIFSAPDMVQNQFQIKIYRIEAELVRERLTWENFKITVRNFIIRLHEKLR